MTRYTAEDVEFMIDEQKNFFNWTYKEYRISKKQLLKLKDKIKHYEKDILKALNLDLGKSEFEAYSNEVGIVLESISYFVKISMNGQSLYMLRHLFIFSLQKALLLGSPMVLS